MVLKSKSRSLNCDKIFKSHITDSGLVSPVLKNSLTDLRKRQPIREWEKDKFFRVANKNLEPH